MPVVVCRYQVMTWFRCWTTALESSCSGGRLDGASELFGGCAVGWVEGGAAAGLLACGRAGKVTNKIKIAKENNLEARGQSARLSNSGMRSEIRSVIVGRKFSLRELTTKVF